MSQNLKSIIKRIDSNWALWAILLLGYLPLISAPTLPDVDLNLVIQPLRDMENLADYFSIFLSKKLFDIQPIRDISLIIDIVVERIINREVFGLFNLLYWSITILFFEKILKQCFNFSNPRLLTLVVAFHPLMAWVISWPTARKHILSCMFVTIATYSYLRWCKKKSFKYGFSTVANYLFSIYSQPISLLFIVPLIIYAWTKNRLKKDRIVLISITVLFAITAGLNHYYYSELYPQFTEVEKIKDLNFSSYFIQLLGLSRSITQLISPIHFAASYAPPSLLSFIGLPIGVILIYIGVISQGLLMTMMSASFVLYPLVLLSISPSNIFVSDTYLLISLINLGIILGLFISKRPESYKAFLVLILLTFLPKNLYEQKLNLELYSKFKISYDREKNCKNTHSYANELLKKHELKAFMEISSIALKNKCGFKGRSGQILLSRIYGFRIYLDPKLSLEQKLDQINSMRLIPPEVVLLKAILMSEMGEEKSPSSMCSKYLKHIELPIKKIIKEEMKKVEIKDCSD